MKNGDNRLERSTAAPFYVNGWRKGQGESSLWEQFLIDSLTLFSSKADLLFAYLVASRMLPFSSFMLLIARCAISLS
ncbi:hypothetical protein LL668_20840 (plasmid) [Providencia rettgeri]|uniref:hypothetical protein n=1 Tax=Providencia rettgeri TaxID=587 RepID=UPI001E430602|nr:hypothetical protein [Providencia rettgeri]UEK61578.1 hypothetical protein LL668_20840 [Providencia rettgeri]